jgi:acyl-ACP thioesterase
MLDEPLVPEPSSGRVYRGERKVRLGDADPSGRLRFDACARYLHDLSNDDTRDAALDDDGSWVVRRTVIDVVAAPRFHERLSLATWCGGTGSRWAERRVSIAGAKGGRVEAASLWVYVDLATFLPKRLGPGFVGLYGEAAGGRTVGSKLLLQGLPADDSVDARPWPLRRTDLDVLAHVNNAAYWCALEELLGERPDLVAGPHRAVVEFAKQLDPGMAVDLRWHHDADALHAWLTVADVVHASLALTPHEPTSPGSRPSVGSGGRVRR